MKRPAISRSPDPLKEERWITGVFPPGKTVDPYLAPEVHARPGREGAA
jgi:hypothetical protein